MSLNPSCRKSVCSSCVGEAHLRAEIERAGDIGRCSFCARTQRRYSLKQIADRIDEAFNNHYQRMQAEIFDEDPSDVDLELIFGPFYIDPGLPVVEAIKAGAGVSGRIATEVRKALEEKHLDWEGEQGGQERKYGRNSCYRRIDADGYRFHFAWVRFEESLRSEARFFSQSAADHLSSIFSGMEELTTKNGRRVLVRAGPGTRFKSFFRARVFQSFERLEEALCWPESHLGPPPRGLALGGRMNAHGISVFYGASHPKTAIAEVRPPVGSYVAVARFDVLKPLTLLNLTAMDEVQVKGSIFDPTSIERLERAAFLRTLSNRITRAVMPNDESFGYLATQAVADFLATAAHPTIDGILFRSVQTPGTALNVVLFHHAAKVEVNEAPQGNGGLTRTRGMLTPDSAPEYTVILSAPASLQNPKDENHGRNTINQSTAISPATLRVALDDIHVHKIEGVAFRSSSKPVNRYKIEVPSGEF